MSVSIRSCREKPADKNNHKHCAPASQFLTEKIMPRSLIGKLPLNSTREHFTACQRQQLPRMVHLYKYFKGLDSLHHSILLETLCYLSASIWIPNTWHRGQGNVPRIISFPWKFYSLWSMYARVQGVDVFFSVFSRYARLWWQALQSSIRLINHGSFGDYFALCCPIKRKQA